MEAVGKSVLVVRRCVGKPLKSSLQWTWPRPILVFRQPHAGRRRRHRPAPCMVPQATPVRPASCPPNHQNSWGCCPKHAGVLARPYACLHAPVWSSRYPPCHVRIHASQIVRSHARTGTAQTTWVIGIMSHSMYIIYMRCCLYRTYIGMNGTMNQVMTKINIIAASHGKHMLAGRPLPARLRYWSPCVHPWQLCRHTYRHALAVHEHKMHESAGFKCMGRPKGTMAKTMHGGCARPVHAQQK